MRCCHLVQEVLLGIAIHNEYPAKYSELSLQVSHSLEGHPKSLTAIAEACLGKPLDKSMQISRCGPAIHYTLILRFDCGLNTHALLWCSSSAFCP